MRRLTRLRKAPSFLPHSPSSSIPHNVRCAALGSPASFSTSQTRALRPTTTTWQDKIPAIADTPVTTAVADLEQEVDALAEDAIDPQIETNLVLPPKFHSAPRPDDVDDPTYVPAETADGLEEVGGLEDWWEREEHWNGSKAFVPFTSTADKVWDASILEATARRAVVEALAVQSLSATAGAIGDTEEGTAATPSLTGLWSVGGHAAGIKALGVQIEVGEDGEAKLVGGQGAAADIVGDLAAAPAESQDGAPFLETAEAKEFVGAWDQSWKRISLKDMRLKFAVMKRIQQLSGHLIPDARLTSINNVRSLLTVLVKPPKPAKLADEIQASKSDLLNLPNVKVYNRRVTPIDKDKMVGRWKVIVSELEKRDLPITGTGKYGRSVERSWVRGGT